MSNISVRRYADEDYEAVKRSLEEGELYHPDLDSKEILESMIIRDPDSVLVAEKGGEVVGNVYVIRMWEGLIFRLAVRKNQRNQGIASALLNAAEEKMRERGIKEYRLFFEADNEELARFYSKRGFQGSGKRYRCMWKRLE